jgi:DUF1707 SHOCT-like domain
VVSLSSLRASDADRERAAEQLRHATMEGRLTPDELEERLEALYVSRTYGELDALVADLPVTRAPVAVRRPFPRPLIGAGAAVALLALLSVFAGSARHAVGPRRGRGLGLPGGPGDAHHVVIAAGAVVTVLSLLVVCVTVVWVLRRSHRAFRA